MRAALRSRLRTSRHQRASTMRRHRAGTQTVRAISGEDNSHGKTEESLRPKLIERYATRFYPAASSERLMPGGSTINRKFVCDSRRGRLVAGGRERSGPSDGPVRGPV